MGNIFQAKLALAAAADNNIAASQSPGAGAILLNGSIGTGNLDAARRILFTSGADDSGITFTVTGKNRNGATLKETITGGNLTASTTQDFLSVSSVTHTGSVAGTLKIGTSGVASTQWFNLNTAGNPPMNLGIAIVVSGTINYTFEYTYDDPNAPFTGTFPTVFNVSALAAKATTLDSSLVTPAFAVRLTQNSFTNPGTAAIIVIQSGIG